MSNLHTYGLLVAIAAICIFFQSQRSAFFSSGNIFILFRSMASLGMIALAEFLVIIAGELDLSVGSIYGLAATTLAVLWTGSGAFGAFRLPFVLALLGALLMGALAGLINAFFTTVVGIPSFIATLGMLNVAQGIELLIGNASNFTPTYTQPAPPQTELSMFEALGSTILPFGIPIEVAWLGFFILLFWIIRHRTLFGFQLLAIGGNPEAAKISRIPIRRYKVAVFVISALVASFAGILDFSYVGSVSPDSGGPLTFPVFAAVIIGGASLTGGKGTVVGTVMGTVLLAVLANGLAILGVGSFAQLTFVGAVTIGAVTLDRLVSRNR